MRVYGSLRAASTYGKSWRNLRAIAKGDRELLETGSWAQSDDASALESVANTARSIGDRDARYLSGASEGGLMPLDLEEEVIADAHESPVPTLSLARDFFQTLAEAADDELDELSPPTQNVTDEERAEQSRRGNRDFLAQYYAMQGVLLPAGGEVDEGDVQALVNSFERLVPSFFAVPFSVPLCRLVVRQQLAELFQHAPSSALRPVAWHDDLISLRPPTEDQLTLRPREQVLLEDYESGILLPSTPAVSSTSAITVDVVNERAVGHSREDELGELLVRLNKTHSRDIIPEAPLSALQWLQRCTASNMLHPTTEGAALLVQLVLMAAVDCEHAPLIADVCPHAEWGLRSAVEGVYMDLCDAFTTMDADKDFSVVAIHSIRYLRKIAGECLMSESAADWGDDDVAVPTPLPADRFLRSERVLHVGTERNQYAPEWLCGACDTVICCPPSTSDAEKVGIADEAASSTATADPRAGLPANNILEVLRSQQKLREKQRTQLYKALRMLRPGGRAYYLVASLDPHQCESVVCEAVAKSGRAFHCVDVLPLVPTEIAERLTKGVSDWCDVEREDGASQGMPMPGSTAFDPELRGAVAAAAARAAPLIPGEGFFMAVIERERVPLMEGPRAEPAEQTHGAAPVLLCPEQHNRVALSLWARRERSLISKSLVPALEAAQTDRDSEVLCFGSPAAIPAQWSPSALSATGFLESTDPQQTVAPGMLLSTALSASQHLLCVAHQLRVPVVALPSACVLSLLYLPVAQEGVVSSATIGRWLGCVGGPQFGAACQLLLAGARAVMQRRGSDSARAADKSVRCSSIVVRPEVPASPEAALHPLVAADFERVGLVVHVTTHASDRTLNGFCDRIARATQQGTSQLQREQALHDVKVPLTLCMGLDASDAPERSPAQMALLAPLLKYPSPAVQVTAVLDAIAYCHRQLGLLYRPEDVLPFGAHLSGARADDTIPSAERPHARERAQEAIAREAMNDARNSSYFDRRSRHLSEKLETQYGIRTVHDGMDSASQGPSWVGRASRRRQRQKPG